MTDTVSRDLIEFLTAAPTPFHAVARMKGALLEAGFVELDEGDSWNIDAMW